MRIPMTIAALTVAMLAGISHAHGQRATEQYIPLGQSPSLSGKYTSIGAVAAVDPQRRTITVRNSSGSYAVKIVDATRIWLDRSKLKQTTVAGSFGDLKMGQKVEVKFQGNDRDRPADWVKVEMLQH